MTMARGSICVMKTIAPGLVKTGKRTNFETHMHRLEHIDDINTVGFTHVFTIVNCGYIEVMVS